MSVSFSFFFLSWVVAFGRHFTLTFFLKIKNGENNYEVTFLLLNMFWIVCSDMLYANFPIYMSMCSFWKDETFAICIWRQTSLFLYITPSVHRRMSTLQWAHKLRLENYRRRYKIYSNSAFVWTHTNTTINLGMKCLYGDICTFG